MGRGGAGLIAAVLILAGCKSTDPKPADKDAAGTTASRTKGTDGKLPTWLDSPGDRSSAGDTGAAREAGGQKFVSGRVLDPFNRPVPKVFIQVEAATATPGLPPVGIYTDESGAFSTGILTAGKSYNLTVDTTLEGKRYLGMVQTLAPRQGITIVLRDDLVVPGGNLRGPTTGGFAPPQSSGDLGIDRIPPPGLTPPMPKPTDGAWSPGFDATKPVPPAIAPTTAKPATVPGGSMPPPDDVSAPIRPTARPENVADVTRNPWASPPVAIPGPPIFPPSVPNTVPPPPAPPPPAAMEAEGSANGFILLDVLKRNWAFPASKSGGIVLLEFMTTDSTPCLDVAPVLSKLQSRYASAGLQVVAVACNERLTEKQRLEAASDFARARDLNYQVMIEPGDVSGIVRNRYKILQYPTTVLLDSSGKVLWQGHPNQQSDHEHRDLELAIQRAIGK